MPDLGWLWLLVPALLLVAGGVALALWLHPLWCPHCQPTRAPRRLDERRRLERRRVWRDSWKAYQR